MHRCVFAPAKLNLSLRVLAREASGYHQIESIFCTLDVGDVVHVTIGGDTASARDEASARDDVALQVIPSAGAPLPDLGPAARNLAVLAVHAFRDAAGIGGGPVAIRLEKAIPAGAGMGGGSSDAAAVLHALNTLHGEPLSRARLMEVGSGLGSDVPFFLAGSAFALAWGRGTRLQPLAAPPAAAVLLAHPAGGVSTAGAYADLAARRGDRWTAPAGLLDYRPDWSAIAAAAVNDFEEVVFEAQPSLGELHASMERCGALFARLTGTGSTVFAVFPGERGGEAAADAAGALRAAHPDVRFRVARTA